jgi:hypothetical protein
LEKKNGGDTGGRGTHGNVIPEVSLDKCKNRTAHEIFLPERKKALFREAVVAVRR